MRPEPEFPSEELAAPEPWAANLNLREYAALLRRHWRILVISLAIALVAFLTYWALATRLYRATVVLNVVPEQAGISDIKASDDGRRQVDPEFLQTQMRLLRSREIAERVVRNLRLAVSPRTGASGKTAETKDQPDATTRAALGVQRTLEVKPVRDTTLVELSSVSPSPVKAARIANAVAEAYIDWGLEARVRSLNERAEFFLSQIAQVKKELDDKEQKLLTYGREKDIVAADLAKNPSFQNLDAFNADYATAVADRVAKEARYQEVRTAPPDSIANTMSSGLVAQLQSDLAKLERDYAEKLNIYKPEWPAMQQLKTQIDKGRQHLGIVIQQTVNKARESARSEYLTAMRREASLKAELRSQKAEAQAASSDAVEYNNIRVEVQTQRALLDTLLRREAETEVLSRLQGERASNVRIVDRALVPSSPFAPSLQKDVLFGLAFGGFVGIGLIFVLSHLDRSLRSPAQVQEVLRLPALAVIPGPVARSRYGAARLYARRKPGEEKNLAPEPVATQQPQTRIAAAYHALRTSLLRARGAARLYPRRKHGEEESGAPELVVVDRPRTRMAEAYRELRTSLLLSRAGGIKSIVVTSAAPQEGKTTLASNLAIALAQLDRTVVLVDGDLYNPRLHEIFCISNRLGLASVLAGQVKPLEVLTATQVPGVTLLPAGPNPPDPSVLLASDSMSHLLTALGSSFDFVVIDSPPVGAVTDAVLLGVHSDGVILCVRAGTTPRELSASARDKLLWSGVRILGAALTMAEDETTRTDYYDAYYMQSVGGAGEKTSSSAQRG
ncbi:MAG TPA: polysaccharide biosynthesis tyrosine autokinase [Thermoanaerobaculia bacterium]